MLCLGALLRLYSPQKLSNRNYDQVVRNASGILLRRLPNFSNADCAEVSGVDLISSYSLDNNWGNWKVGLHAAWIGTYDLKVGSTTYDSIGSYNFFTPVARPLPAWKINGAVSWSMDNH